MDRAAGRGAAWPHDDATEVTAGQIRGLVARLQAAGQWEDGDPPVLVVLDAGYDVVRLAWLLADLPVQLVGRVRSDRVFAAAAGGYAGLGRRARHGALLKCDDQSTWRSPDSACTDMHARYGQVAVQAWARMHPRLTPPRRLVRPRRSAADRGRPDPYPGRPATR